LRLTQQPIPCASIASTTLSDVVAAKATKAVAVCAVSNLLALATAGAVSIQQLAPFGDVDIRIVSKMVMKGSDDEGDDEDDDEDNDEDAHEDELLF
jgi:chromatin segregation and condensation protein Rec8/ScpA/Scc1 (kleisin family)